MTVKVLVTTDGSNLSDKAVESAVALSKALGALIGVTAVPAPPPAAGFQAEDEAVRDRLAAISRKAEEAGVECEVVAEHPDAVWKAILECADRHDVSYIVMASRGLGSIGSFLLGERNPEGAPSGRPPRAGRALSALRRSALRRERREVRRVRRPGFRAAFLCSSLPAMSLDWRSSERRRRPRGT